MSWLNAWGIVCAVVGLFSAAIMIGRGKGYGWLLALGPTLLLILNIAIATGVVKP